ncbi:MAB_1171c family putative transporter [Streptomyces sp. NPDC051362]|uniref:MAB_1171c family putative transporter n=1 Tax=Streptomyces sp. NPDC051362 TaxID=3365651 RepID=UPI0037996AEB
MTRDFWIIAAVLGIGLAYKLPSFLRGVRNPLARQVVGLLVAACCVFFFAAPTTIAAVNDLTGIPNFSAPWVYTLLVGFCASCLLLIVKWRGGTPESVRRATWWVYGSYGAGAVGLWVCFAMGDHHVERTRDLDTYYATTPWMREMILIYLLGHTVAVVITSALLWTWERRVRGTGWLHAGVVLLTVGYALNLAYDAVKLIPYFARWAGRTDLDYLSTDVAPPVAALVGLLIALGFIVPHAGQSISQRLSASRAYRALGPLARTLDQVPSASAPVALGRFTALNLRLTRRKTSIRDALRTLSPYLDDELRERTLARHLDQGVKRSLAEALADAAAITAAVQTLRDKRPAAPKPTARQRPPEGGYDLISISRAMRKGAVIRASLQAALQPEGVMS